MLSLAACSSQVSSRDRNAYLSHLDVGDYHGAEVTATRAGRIGMDGQTSNMVWALNAGSALFDEGLFKQTIAVLDATERLAQADDLDMGKAALDYNWGCPRSHFE